MPPYGRTDLVQVKVARGGRSSQSFTHSTLIGTLGTGIYERAVWLTINSPSWSFWRAKTTSSVVSFKFSIDTLRNVLNFPPVLTGLSYDKVSPCPPSIFVLTPCPQLNFMHRVVGRVTFVLILVHGFANVPYVPSVSSETQLTPAPASLRANWQG